MNRHFELQGHRGARGLFPENTLEGFRAALEFGVSSVELDVAVTADGVPVVVHDPVLNPDLARVPDLMRGLYGTWLTGPGPRLRDLKLADLAHYDVGRARPGSAVARAHPWQRPIDGARIPTLDAVFQALAGSGVIVDVELKTDPTRPELSVSPVEMAEAVMASATRCNALRHLAVRSFDWRGLYYLRAAWPDLRLGWLTCAETANRAWWGDVAVPGRQAIDAVAIASGGRALTCWAPHYSGLDAALIARGHALGLSIVPWTVNAPADMDRLLGWGVDGFCTDRPDLGRDAIERAGRK